MLLSAVDLTALQHRRKQALAAPLVPGTVLAPSGPPLHLSAITPSREDIVALPTGTLEFVVASTNPYRPPLADLRSIVTSASGPRSLRLRLLRLLCGGEDSWTQVWQAEATSNGKKLGKVVVKLVAEALFPDWTEDGFWQPANEAVEAESRAYSAFRPVQGRDVPHCYGAFSFEMPCGEFVTGLLLEDLSESSKRVITHCREEREAGSYASLDQVDLLMDTAYRQLHRLQELGVTSLDLSPGDLLVLNSSDRLSSLMHLVYLDFGGTKDADTLDRELRQREEEMQRELGPWQGIDELLLQQLFVDLVPDAASEWMSREGRESRVGLWMFMAEEELEEGDETDVDSEE
ncbi:hypothetical protein JCM8097_005083 [Rhodosporidiobolus ruineniae]